MKKILLAIAIAFTLVGKAQTIVSSYSQFATYDFGIDSITKIDRKLLVYDFEVNAKNRIIAVYYMWNSAVGISIRADFANDMNKINSFNTITNNLQQQ